MNDLKKPLMTEFNNLRQENQNMMREIDRLMQQSRELATIVQHYKRSDNNSNILQNAGIVRNGKHLTNGNGSGGGNVSTLSSISNINQQSSAMKINTSNFQSNQDQSPNSNNHKIASNMFQVRSTLDSHFQNNHGSQLSLKSYNGDSHSNFMSKRNSTNRKKLDREEKFYQNFDYQIKDEIPNALNSDPLTPNRPSRAGNRNYNTILTHNINQNNNTNHMAQMQNKVPLMNSNLKDILKSSANKNIERVFKKEMKLV